MSARGSHIFHQLIYSICSFIRYPPPPKPRNGSEVFIDPPTRYVSHEEQNYSSLPSTRSIVSNSASGMLPSFQSNRILSRTLLVHRLPHSSVGSGGLSE